MPVFGQRAGRLRWHGFVVSFTAAHVTTVIGRFLCSGADTGRGVSEVTFLRMRRGAAFILRPARLGGLTLAFVGCVSGPAPRRGDPGATFLARPARPAPADLSGSLFDQAWAWDDERGGRVRFSEWRGKLVVVSLVYTSCTTVCPLAIEKMRQVSATLDREGRAAEYVLVTLDPTNDTPEQLRLFKEARGLPKGWHLLRGSPEQTDALATFLRLKILNTGDHVFHEAKLVFLDSSGKVMGHVRG